MNSLVSVIIPVYKVEKYIEKCMQSLLDQTYTNFEALIVDDGSPDDSIKLAKALVGDDSRFIFFEKENGGQGTARNLALDNAKGDYIAFLDSDDYYDTNYLRVMLGKITQTSSDICTCDVNYVDEKGDQLRVHRNDVDAYIKNKDFLMAHWHISNFMWDKLFKADCFDSFRFDPSVKTYEDVHLLFRVVFGRKLTSVKDILYNYVQREGSTMRSMPLTYIDDRYKIFLETDEFYQKKLVNLGVDRDVVNYYFLNNFILNAINTICIYSTSFSNDLSKLLSKDTDNLFTFYNIMKNKNLKINTKLRLSLIKISPKTYKNLLIILKVLKTKLSQA